MPQRCNVVKQNTPPRLKSLEISCAAFFATRDVTLHKLLNKKECLSPKKKKKRLRREREEKKKKKEKRKKRTPKQTVKQVFRVGPDQDLLALVHHRNTRETQLFSAAFLPDTSYDFNLSLSHPAAGLVNSRSEGLHVSA